MPPWQFCHCTTTTTTDDSKHVVSQGEIINVPVATKECLAARVRFVMLRFWWCPFGKLLKLPSIENSLVAFLRLVAKNPKLPCFRIRYNLRIFLHSVSPPNFKITSRALWATTTTTAYYILDPSIRRQRLLRAPFPSFLASLLPSLFQSV